MLRLVQKALHHKLHKLIQAKAVEIRESAGFTQRALARELGCSQNIISRLEKGGRKLDVLELYWLCVECHQDPVVVFSELAAELVEADEED